MSVSGADGATLMFDKSPPRREAEDTEGQLSKTDCLFLGVLSVLRGGELLLRHALSRHNASMQPRDGIER